MRRLLILLAALSLVGCGTQREASDLLTPRSPARLTFQAFVPAGVGLFSPVNWRREVRPPPGIFEISSGAAVMAGWAYERSEPLPRTGSELARARERLLEEVLRRDPMFELRSVRTQRVAGAPAIEIAGEQTVLRRRLRVRSVHVFKGRVEYVMEALAPPADFERVDREAFAPLLRTLQLAGRIG